MNTYPKLTFLFPRHAPLKAKLVSGVTLFVTRIVGLHAATIADWQFNAANPTADSSGNGNTLVFSGDITFSSDVASNAPEATNSAVFDGNPYAQTVATLNLTSYNQLTVEFFAKYMPANGLQMFCAQGNPNTVVGAFYFDMGEASATDLKVSQSTSLGFETDVSPGPTDGGWHHFALTLDATGSGPAFKIYVDGIEVDTGTAAGYQTFINDYFTIGAYPPSYDFNYVGNMGEMRISSGILTPSQFLIGAPPPQIFISRQPFSTAAVTNSPAAFNVVATVQGGNPTPTLQYQWQLDGTNVEGATNGSYILPTATLGENSSQFDVVLSASGATTVTSSVATLTVATNSTVADWRFDAANPTADSSGNGNDLTFGGDAITFTSDVATNEANATNSAIFDGNAYAQTVGTLNLSNYNAITIEFFAKYSPGNGLQMFYSQNNPNNVTGAFYLDMPSGFETDVAPGPVDGNWHHV
jgi:hypothetical protein